MACTCNANSCTPIAEGGQLPDPRWRRALWVALVINATMFFVEWFGGWKAESVSLLADAIDFAGDAFNYGVSLAVLSLAIVWRSRAAWFKGATMFGYGLFVLGKTAWMLHTGSMPEPYLMGGIALLALLANVGTAVMLYAFRNGDANMRSVWICSRNDALSNLAVIAAALGVLGTDSALPDLLVATLMAGLALSGGVEVMRKARQELKLHAPAQA